MAAGASYTLTATVSPASGTATPTGNVVFTIGSDTDCGIELLRHSHVQRRGSGDVRHADPFRRLSGDDGILCEHIEHRFGNRDWLNEDDADNHLGATRGNHLWYGLERN